MTDKTTQNCNHVFTWKNIYVNGNKSRLSKCIYCDTYEKHSELDE